MTRRAIIIFLNLAALACRAEPEPAPTRVTATESEPEDHLIHYACQGFDEAVAEGAPENRLLSTTAKHAIALGGPPVEAASQRWALLPPGALLELIDRYEREAKPDPQQCAGLRAHLDRMNQRAATH